MPRIREHRWNAYAYAGTGRATSAAANGATVLAVDTETEGLAFHDRAFCVTFTYRDPFTGELVSAYVDTDEAQPDALSRRIAVRRVLEQFPVWVFHNAKFDLQKLELDGMLPDVAGHTIHDTQTIAYLLNEHRHKGLKELARVVLGETTNEEERLKVVRRKLGLKKEDGYYYLPRTVVIPYAMKDTEFTLRLFETLMPQLEQSIEADPLMAEVYAMEQRVSEVFRRMEARGFRVNVEYLEQTADEYGKRVMEGLGKIKALAGDETLNPNSPLQLKKAFAARGFDVDSTAEDVIRELDDDLARAILQYRSDAKIHKTYLRGLLNEQVDGVVHPWFNPVGARTGRTSSSSAHA